MWSAGVYLSKRYDCYCAGYSSQNPCEEESSRGLFSPVYGCQDFPEESVEAKLKRILQSVSNERREGA